MITLIGGGGKTSLLYALLRFLKARGIHAVGATTTKIYHSDCHAKQIRFVPTLPACLEAAKEAADFPDITMLCFSLDRDDPAKATGIPAEWLDTVVEKQPDILLVVEGDGSAGRSLKGHLPHDPVIPAASKLIIPVIGIDAVGKPINQETVHRVQRFCELSGGREQDRITEDMVVNVLFHPEGYLRHAPPAAEIIPFLNKAETLGAYKHAIRLGEKLTGMNRERIRFFAFGSVHQSCYAIRKLQH
jgi:probable selenium-dependent hydroxylase accessory protein YqeC